MASRKGRICIGKNASIGKKTLIFPLFLAQEECMGKIFFSIELD